MTCITIFSSDFASKNMAETSPGTDLDGRSNPWSLPERLEKPSGQDFNSDTGATDDPTWALIHEDLETGTVPTKQKTRQRGIKRSRQRFNELQLNATTTAAAAEEAFNSSQNPEWQRPNRFTGPRTTWYEWTRSERDTVSSLNQARINDLSTHLYVAHCIKKSARGSAKQPRGVQSEQRDGLSSPSSKRVEDGGERNTVGGSDQGVPFVPPKLWTAWPMLANQVPRVFHTTGILTRDELAYHEIRQGMADNRPSADLEGEIIAVAQRAARRSWAGREWEGEEEQETMMDRKDQTSFQRSQDPTRPLFASSQPIQPARSPSLQVPGSPFGRLSQTVGSSSPPPSSLVSLSTSSSLGRSGSESCSRSPSPNIPSTASFRPVPTADDERAHHLLLPLARRTIDKVDSLLMALHDMRQAQTQNWKENQSGKSKERRRAGEKTKPGTERRKKAEEGRASKPREGRGTRQLTRSMREDYRRDGDGTRNENRKDKQDSHRTSKTSKNHSSGKGTTAYSSTRRSPSLLSSCSSYAASDISSPSPSSSSSSSTVSNSEEEPKPSKRRNDRKTKTNQEENKNKPPPKPRLILRDWSELLGVAALTGVWDESVVEKTRQRCESLFGGDTRFGRLYPLENDSGSSSDDDDDDDGYDDGGDEEEDGDGSAGEQR